MLSDYPPRLPKYPSVIGLVIPNGNFMMCCSNDASSILEGSPRHGSAAVPTSALDNESEKKSGSYRLIPAERLHLQPHTKILAGNRPARWPVLVEASKPYFSLRHAAVAPAPKTPA
jgi:hypothetical protein